MRQGEGIGDSSVSADWLLSCLRDVVRRLAADAEEQNAYVEEGGFHHDELALELDDALPAISWRGILSESALVALRTLDQKLYSMSGEAHSDLWTSHGLKCSHEWQEIRDLARAAYAELPEPGEDTPGLT